MKQKLAYYHTMQDLYLDNFKLVYVFLGDYTIDSEIKKDIASQVWLKVMERSEKVLSMDKYWVENYLRKVCKTTALDYFKAEEWQKKKLQEINDYLQLITYDNAPELVFHEEEIEYLHRARKVLSEEEQSFIEMRYYMKMSITEISQVLEITEGNVRIRQHRIIEKLRKEIRRIMKEDED